MRNMGYLYRRKDGTDSDFVKFSEAMEEYAKYYAFSTTEFMARRSARICGIMCKILRI